MLKQRILTALVIGPLLIALILFLPERWWDALVVVFFAAIAFEWTRLSGVNAMTPRLILSVCMIAPVAIMLFVPQWNTKPLILAGTPLWLLATTWLSQRRFLGEDTPLSTSLKVFFGALVVLIAALSMDGILAQQAGRHLLLLLFILIWAADVGAYVFGRLFGRHKLSPQISPGKTWEGLVGGQIVVIAAVLIATRFAWFESFATGPMIALAVLTALASVIGDLFVSLLKRQRGLKDTGRLFPGHGGMLDRFDSLMAALPIFLSGILLFGLKIGVAT